MAVDADLEVQVTADAAGVAGLPHRPDPLAGLEPLAGAGQRPLEQVRVDEVAPRAAVVDEQVVALEVALVGALQDPPPVSGDQRRAAGRGDVEALVDAVAVAGRAVVA